MSQLRIWIWKSDYPGWNLGFITYQFMTEHLNTKTSLSVKWVNKGGLNKPVWSTQHSADPDQCAAISCAPASSHSSFAQNRQYW